MAEKSRNGARRGFTVVELLVVVAIIAVLIALLIPALAHAKELAKTSACLANLKACGIAMVTYGADNQDSIPQSGSILHGSAYWYKFYNGNPNDSGGATGVGIPAGIPVYLSGTTLCNTTYIPKSAFCPKNDDIARPTLYPAVYGMLNDSHSGDSYAPVSDRVHNSSGDYNTIALNFIYSPQDYALLMDTAGEAGSAVGDIMKMPVAMTSQSAFSSYRMVNSGGGVEGLWMHHSAGANGLFADGHGECCNAQRFTTMTDWNYYTNSSHNGTGITWWLDQDGNPHQTGTTPL